MTIAVCDAMIETSSLIYNEQQYDTKVNHIIYIKTHSLYSHKELLENDQFPALLAP